MEGVDCVCALCVDESILHACAARKRWTEEAKDFRVGDRVECVYTMLEGGKKPFKTFLFPKDRFEAFRSFGANCLVGLLCGIPCLDFPSLWLIDRVSPEPFAIRSGVRQKEGGGGTAEICSWNLEQFRCRSVCSKGNCAAGWQ